MTIPDVPIADDAISEEAIFNPKFVSMWADRCIALKKKHGQAVANAYAQGFLTPRTVKLVNEEILRRRASKNKENNND